MKVNENDRGDLENSLREWVRETLEKLDTGNEDRADGYERFFPMRPAGGLYVTMTLIDSRAGAVGLAESRKVAMRAIEAFGE